MARMDGQRLGKLAVDIRGLREQRARHEAALVDINGELAEKEPVFARAMLDPQLVSATIEGTQV